MASSSKHVLKNEINNNLSKFNDVVSFPIDKNRLRCEVKFARNINTQNQWVHGLRPSIENAYR
jgi:hypothetical protein